MPIVRFSDVGSAGWMPDLPAHELSEQPLAWSDIRNFKFVSGLAERAEGYAAAFDTTPTQICYGLFNAVKVDGTPFLIGAGTNKAYIYNGTNETEITGSTIASTADLKWSGGILTGFIVLNETTTDPQYIAVSALSNGTTTNLAALTNWPASTTCKTIRPFKYFLVAGGMTESSTVYPYKVRWSTSAVPGTLPASWVATTSNDAGSIDLSDDYGPVVDMIPIGDQLAIYRTSGITMMRHIGGTDAANRLVMAFSNINVGKNGGMIGLNCGCDVASVGNVVLSENDVYVFDGTKITSIVNNRVRRFLFRYMDKTNRKRSFVFNNSADNEVWICYPTQGNTACDKALIWNYADNTISYRGLPNATAGVHGIFDDGLDSIWSGISGTWDNQTTQWSNVQGESVGKRTVLSSSDGKLYTMGRADDANGTALVAYLERQNIALGDNERVKYVRAVWPRFDAATGQQITVSVGTTMNVNEAISWQAEQTFTVGTTRKIDVNRAGRFISLRFRSSSGQQWRLRSFDFDVRPQGMY